MRLLPNMRHTMARPPHGPSVARPSEYSDFVAVISTASIVRSMSHIETAVIRKMKSTTVGAPA